MSVKIQIPEAFKGLFESWRYKVFYGGRGGAKSHNFARAILIIGMQRKIKVLCCREIQKSIKDSVHALLKNIIYEYGLTDIYEVQNDVIKNKLNGTEIVFIGLKHNVTGVKSNEGIDIAWVEEAENVSDNSWEILIPTVRKPNSEIWISFNTKNITDPTYQRFVANATDDMLVKKVSWADNPFFPEVLKEEMAKLKEQDEEAYLHIWEGEPDTRRSGAVYARKIAKAREEGRICRVPYDPSYEVFTAWDLGWGDSTAIWWLQFVGRELRWLDYYENSGELLPHYVKIVKEKEYNYKTHYLPHDADAGNIRGESVSMQLNKLGLRNVVLPRSTDLRAERELLNAVIDYSVFDENKCKDGIFALESYHFEWDENKATFKKDPLHDWSSHCADAARYAAVAANLQKGLIRQKPEDVMVNNLPAIAAWKTKSKQSTRI